MQPRKVVLLILISAIMMLSSLTAISPVKAADVANWNTNGNYGFNWNYVSQSSLSSSTVNSLSLKWVLPLPPPPAPYTLNGITVTPLIENGVAYFITADSTLYAVDTSTGAILWHFHVNIPPVPGPLTGSSYHAHNSDIFYSSTLLGQPLVWFMWEGNGYQVYALNAISGQLVVNYSVPFSNLPGVKGSYQFTGRNAVLDEKDGILVIGTGSISEAASIARGFFIALNVKTNPPTVLWETPVMPPQDGSDPNWDIESINSMQYAWIFNGTGAVNLKELPQSVLNSTFYDDWGFARHLSFNGTNSFAGTSTGWGGPWAVDPTHGVVYVTTDQASPDWNATFRPGPNLWADSIMAVNLTTGKIIWAFQTTPHDIWDFDCSWSVLLVNITVNGQNQEAVLKGCKNGYFYALNAQTGQLIWVFNPPNIVRENTWIANIFNETQMKWPWAFYPATSGIQNPCGTGGFESDPAYNPQTGLVYVAAYNCASQERIIDVAPTPGVSPDSAGLNFAGGGAGSAPVYNTTVWAINVATGKPVWSVFINGQGFRGGVTTTSDLLLVPLNNGTIDVFDAANGKLVAQPFTGAGMDTQPAIGTDPSGNVLILQPLGAADASIALPGLTPSIAAGTIVAMTLKAPPTTQTVTCGQGTNLVNGVCEAVTGPSGINPTLFYGILVVAVIFIITTLILAVTRRRPTTQ